MKELPANQLDPRVKTVWRISDAIWICLLFICCGIAFPIVAIADPSAGWAWTVTACIAASWALCLIVWRKRIVIPFIRVQNTDTRQGPIQRAFGLASVTVATAAGEHEIPGLASAVAEQLRDKAAELARIAQEDL